MKNELPFERSWWIEVGKVIGGRFPGTPDPVESASLLGRLLDVGVRVVINLQETEECGSNGRPFPDYVPILRKIADHRRITVEAHRLPIRDMKVPTAARMHEILDAIDRAIAAGQLVYVHCWGGHGRTGTVAGCWLVRAGASCTDALQAIEHARRDDAYLAQNPAPQTEAQLAFVRSWPRNETRA